MALNHREALMIPSHSRVLELGGLLGVPVGIADHPVNTVSGMILMIQNK